VNRLSSVADNNPNCTNPAVAPATVPVSYSRSFGYDGLGNLYISGAVGIGAAGNQTVVNGKAVAYDAEDRQISVAYAGSAETYVYL